MKSALTYPAPFCNPLRDADDRPAVDSLTVADLAANVLHVFDGASAADLADGLTWYRREGEGIRAKAEGIAPGNVNVCRALLYAVTCLSPLAKWEDANVPAAVALVRAIYRGETVPPVQGVGREKAETVVRAILAGATAEDIARDYFKTAPKTAAFVECLSDYLNAHSVCCDLHAYNIACHTLHVTSPRDGSPGMPGLTSRGRYAKLSDAYRRAAAARGVLPLEMQAATWVAWRNALRGRGAARRAVGYTHDA